jgi:murein L,D-transpeptidase YcbB/YkuD
VDPQIAPRAAKPGKNPLYQQLQESLEAYHTTWGSLPHTRVPPGPELKAGSKGVRTAALRQRLGLNPMPAPATYDEELEAAVVSFQHVHGLDETGRVDAATLTALNAGPEFYEKAIEANIERARLLPARFGDRYLLVDVAAGRVALIEHGEATVVMKVVTGKPSQPTPVMAAMARYLIFNPYWNVPDDLVRTSIAPKVLARGLSYVEEEGLQVLSDYTDQAEELDPATVDWKAVARGTKEVRIRQRPGPKNMMGQVKLMLPNPLGVYLHDTPLKGDFAKSQRLASSGCVRLEDAVTLARALVGDAAVDRALDGSGEEQRVDLKKPVPVYITYLTVMPTAEGVVFRPDVYGRDKAWARRQAAAASTVADAR